MIVVEHKNKLILGAQAFIVGEDDREIAWAEKHVRKDNDLRWILGNFVEADRANSNGHIFPLDDLKAAVETIPNKPLNMLHRMQRNVGTFVAAELLHPEMKADAGNAYIEALAAFWRSIFPEEAYVIEAAHKDGSLFYSMECMPETLTCADGCGQTFAYMGPVHDSYCDHLKKSRVAAKVLNKPHFNGGALIVPPVQPGWKRADITELSNLIEENLEEAEALYEAIKNEFSHLEPNQWEQMMSIVMAFHARGLSDLIPEDR